MSFNWSDFLALAEALFSNPDMPGPDEASLRSVTSRAYYAAFCSARNFARDYENLNLTQTAKDHQLVIRHFQKSQNPIHRKIGRNLRRLRDHRNKADYEDSLARPNALTQSAVTLTRNLLSSLNIQAPIMGDDADP